MRTERKETDKTRKNETIRERIGNQLEERNRETTVQKEAQRAKKRN